MRGIGENRGEANPASWVCAGSGASRICCLFFCFIVTAGALAAVLPEKTFDLTISHGALPAQQRVLQVGKDDVVRLRVTADVAGEIHVHAYRLDAKVTPGIPAELSFRARATGRYRIEWHLTGETAKKSDHHGPSLAILEVRPK